MSRNFDQMLLHDMRMRGTFNFPNWINANIKQTAPLQRALNVVKSYASWYGRFRRLMIVGHGIEAFKGRGGYGIYFGQDNIVVDNVQNWRIIRGVVDLIELHACKVAAVSPVDVYGRGDGTELCQKIAINSGATVLAGEVDQIFLNYGDHSVPGRWQGQVYKFYPNGGRGVYGNFDTYQRPIAESLS